MKFEQEGLGTVLLIEILDEHIVPSHIQEAFGLVEKFEKKYSRFIPGNLLDTLNKNGGGFIDEEIQTLLRVCQKVYMQTEGNFDITIAPLLEAMGYGKNNSLSSNIGMEFVKIDGNTLTLKNNVCLEFGGIGKGYLVDSAFAFLKNKGYTNYIVNFGGDIKVSGLHTLGLEDPNHPEKIIGTIPCDNNALCGSSGKKRIFGDHHHLISAKTGQSIKEVLSVFTVHKQAVFADVYATALFVSPLEISLKIVEETSGLEALIIQSDGTIYKSRRFDVTLY